MYAQFIKWAVILLLTVFLSSCGEKSSFNSISDAYSRAHKRFFSHEKNGEVTSGEDPVVAELKRKLQDSERERERLSSDIKNLKSEIKKQQLAISLQGKVIKLLDDSNHTLQKNIEEQIAAQSFDNDSAVSFTEP